MPLSELWRKSSKGRTDVVGVLDFDAVASATPGETVPVAVALGKPVALDASQTPSVNAGDHVCKAIVPSRFDPARIYLAGGGLVGGKNGVVIAAVNFGGVPDPAFGGGGFAVSWRMMSRAACAVESPGPGSHVK